MTDETANKTLTRRAGKAAQKVFTPGRTVNARWGDEEGDEHYPATYVRRLGNGRHLVKWHDGGEEGETNHVLPHWKDGAATIDPAIYIPRGAEVSALWSDGQMYPAVYVAERASGEHRVRWVDGGEVAEVSRVEVAGEASKAKNHLEDFGYKHVKTEKGTAHYKSPLGSATVKSDGSWTHSWGKKGQRTNDSGNSASSLRSHLNEFYDDHN